MIKFLFSNSRIKKDDNNAKKNEEANIQPSCPAKLKSRLKTIQFNSEKLAPVVYPPEKSLSKGHEVLGTPTALSV